MSPSQKLTDKQLYALLDTKIVAGEYIFTKHAKKRQKDRTISDLEVLNILEGRVGCRRHRNKKKDSFSQDKQSWKYCIEGVNPDKQKIRIIISFEGNLIPIITVMWVD